MTKKNTRDIQLSVELDASPEDVFLAVTEGTEIAKWLAPEARSTAPEGVGSAKNLNASSIGRGSPSPA